MQLETDKITDISGVVSVDVKYNEFKMENLKKMEDLDSRISEQIRNLQANDYCNSNEAATKLDNEVIPTYKPSIFSLDIGNYKETPGTSGGKIYDNY